ncbi:MAG TPA: hypothetical protein VGF30_11985 [Bacteroidia bacterium]
MKTLIFILALVSGTCMLPAQVMQPDHTSTVNPPKPVLSKFTTEYPGVNPAWDQEENYYTAQYIDQGSNMGKRIVYDKTGTIISIDYEMETNNYPAGINEYYLKNYPYETFKVWMSKDPRGHVMYYTRRSSGVLRFDKNGKYLSTKPSIPK